MKLPPLWWQAVKPLLPESTFGSRESTINNYSVAAVEKLAHDLGDDRAQEAVAGLEKCFVGGKKGVEVPEQALPEGRGAGFAGAVGFHLPGYMQPGGKILHGYCDCHRYTAGVAPACRKIRFMATGGF